MLGDLVCLALWVISERVLLSAHLVTQSPPVGRREELLVPQQGQAVAQRRRRALVAAAPPLLLQGAQMLEQDEQKPTQRSTSGSCDRVRVM